MIYYEDKYLIIRTMREADILELKNGFDDQGWSKDIEILSGYFQKQEKGERYIIIAEYNKKVAGYVTLLPKAKNGPFANKNIPVLIDFIVFQKYQRKGIGSKILDVAESIAAQINDTVTLAVGLHSGYGSAQKMYVKRGYIPDGSGIWYNEKPLEENADCKNNDDLVLHFSKALKR